MKAETLSARDLAIYVGSPYKMTDDVISGGQCWPELAYNFVIEEGMLTEEQCSYESEKYKELAYINRRPCPRKVPRFHIDDYEILCDEKLIVEALKTIPALAMVISIDNFFFEWKDVFEIYEPKPQIYDNNYDLHTVTVVGYGRCNITGKEYWIIKNSSGNRWGDNNQKTRKRSVPGNFSQDCVMTEVFWSFSTLYYILDINGFARLVFIYL